MTTVKSKGAGHKAPTPSPYLVGFWPMWDGSGNDLADKSGNGKTLSAPASVDAGFWANNGFGSFVTAGDRFSTGSTTDVSISGLNTSFIISFLWKSGAITGGGNVIVGQRDKSNFYGMELTINTAGTITCGYTAADQATQNMVSTTDINDSAQHHIVFVVDRTGNRDIYVDNASDYASGLQDMTAINADTSTSNTAEFMIGARGKLADASAALGNETVIPQIGAMQLYTKQGALPTGSDLTDLINYLYTHPYQFITSDKWGPDGTY